VLIIGMDERARQRSRDLLDQDVSSQLLDTTVKTTDNYNYKATLSARAAKQSVLLSIYRIFLYGSYHRWLVILAWNFSLFFGAA